MNRFFKNGSVYFIALLLAFIGAILAFGYIVDEVLLEHEVAFDNRVLHAIAAHYGSAPMTRFMKFVTYFASAPFMQIGFAALILFYVLRTHYKRAFEIAGVGMGGFLLNYCMKLVFHRIRPPHPLIAPLQNFSFPSGHATSGFIFYGLLAFLVWQTQLRKPVKLVLAAMLLLFSLLIGFSRLYLRVHYPTDVLAGFCVGFLWLASSIWVIRRIHGPA